jgi:ribosome recycling factor
LSIHEQRFTIYGAARASNTLIDGEMPVPLFTEFFMSEKDVIKETKPRMEAAIDDVRRKLATVRTGRAAVSLLDNIQVDYYGTPTPLNQMASVHAPEPQMLTVQPWDQTQVANVEKAIRAADLGLNPSNDGKLVRIPIPPLTEERRKQLARQVHEIAEEHRTAIRNIRRDENDKLKKMLKDKSISEDAERDGLDEVQKLTDSFISKIDELSKSKEHEIMSI